MFFFNIFDKLIIHVRSDIVRILLLFILIVFHFCSEGEPCQLHANNFLFLCVDLAGIFILLALETIESIYWTACIEINTVHIYEKILRANVVRCANIMVHNVVFLEPGLSILDINGNFTITFISSEDELFDAPRCKLGGLVAAPIKCMLFSDIVNHNCNIRSANVLFVDRDGIIPGVFHVFNLEIEALSSFKRSQEIPRLNLVIGVSVSQGFLKYVTIFLGCLIQGDARSFLIIVNITEPKTCFANLIVTKEEESSMICSRFRCKRWEVLLSTVYFEWTCVSSLALIWRGVNLAWNLCLQRLCIISILIQILNRLFVDHLAAIQLLVSLPIRFVSIHLVLFGRSSLVIRSTVTRDTPSEWTLSYSGDILIIKCIRLLCGLQLDSITFWWCLISFNNSGVPMAKLLRRTWLPWTNLLIQWLLISSSTIISNS